MPQQRDWETPSAAVIFACLQGVLAAVVQVTRTNLTWLVAQTQPTMSLRVVLQMISGVLAITLASVAAATAKRFGGAWLVAALAFLVIPLSVGMSVVAADGSVLVRHILTYGIAIAFIQAFSYPAHDNFLNRLVALYADPVRNKAIVVRLRNSIQFVGRIVIWIGLAIGALTVVGVAAARSTYLLEAVFMGVFGLVVVALLRRGGSPLAASVIAGPKASQTGNVAKEPWQWNHPLLGVFALEFALNCFFLGILMLPRLLPDKNLATLYYVLSGGALGAMLGAVLTRMTRLSLWGFVLLDILTVLFTYSQHSTIAIGIGWFLANVCYGATDTIFARAVQAGTSDRTANLASLRRLLMAGLLNFTLFGIVQVQVHFELSDRQICFVSICLTSLMVSLCWMKRRWINQALDVAVHT